MDAAFLKFTMAPDRVTPVGIAAVDNNVPRLELFRQIVHDGIDERTGRHVHENGPRWIQRCMKSGETGYLLESGFALLFGCAPELEARHNHFLLEGLHRQAATHAAQANDPKLIDDLYHVRSPLFTPRYVPV